MEHGPLSLGGLSFAELGKRVWSEMSDDNVWDAAAQLGYYFILALFPLLIFLLSLVSVVQSGDLVTPLMQNLRDVMPTQAYELVGREIERILTTSNGGLLTFGMLGTIWAASSGVVSLIGTINRAYEAKERRGYVKLRAVSVGLTVALVLLLIGGSLMITMGDQIVGAVTGWLGLAGAAKVIGTAINYLLGFALLFAALELVYYFGPNIEDQKWHWISPGSIAGVVLFVLSSVAFTLYLRFNDSYSVTYGSIGAVIVLLLWLYLLGLSIVIGAEINSEIAKEADARGNAEAPDDNIGTAEGEARRDAAARTSADSPARTDEEARPAAAKAPESSPAAAESRPTPATRTAGASTPPRAPVPPPTHPLAGDPALASIASTTSTGANADELVLRDLLTALVHDNARVRAGAAMTLGHVRPTAPGAISLLVKCLGDESLEVREAAARALTRIGEPAVPALAEAAANAENIEARRAADLTLARIRRAA